MSIESETDIFFLTLKRLQLITPVTWHRVWEITPKLIQHFCNTSEYWGTTLWKP